MSPSTGSIALDVAIFFSNGPLGDLFEIKCRICKVMIKDLIEKKAIFIALL